MRLRLLTVFFLSLPFIPSAVNSFQIDCAGNPLAPISTGNSQAPQPFSWHSSTRLAYFSAFLSCASPTRVSIDTIHGYKGSFISDFKLCGVLSRSNAVATVALAMDPALTFFFFFKISPWHIVYTHSNLGLGTAWTWTDLAHLA